MGCRRLLCLAWLLVWPAIAHAQPAATANCATSFATPVQTGASDLLVTLDPTTLWRPQVSQVRFLLSRADGSAAVPPQVQQVIVCFRWHTNQPAAQPAPFLPATLVQALPGSAGALAYGAVIPPLPTNIGDVTHVSLGIVPLAEMQVAVQLPDNSWRVVLLPVGVTSVPLAVLLLILSLGTALAALLAFVPAALLPDAAGYSTRLIRAASWLNRHFLGLIAMEDGVASLSQLQILIWTFVVLAAAVYVMVLSGNLVNISEGTLYLLGIAGGAGLWVRAFPIDGTAPPGTKPRWVHLFKQRVTDKEIDLTRVQMLLFTLLTAVFVSLQVISTYSIPEIPDNMLILMGLSNTVYLAGRSTPVSNPKPSP